MVELFVYRKRRQQCIPESITLVLAILFIVYGILGAVILALWHPSITYSLPYSFFIVLGLAFFFFTTDTTKTILGIIGMIGSFYAAISWSNFIQHVLWTQMTLFSLILLALSFGAVCRVTCTWPNLDYD
ncbi:MAG: hypothetical protein RTV31_09310 [Candidatus Thorarchaeota archaeon]